LSTGDCTVIIVMSTAHCCTGNHYIHCPGNKRQTLSNSKPCCHDCGNDTKHRSRKNSGTESFAIIKSYLSSLFRRKAVNRIQNAFWHTYQNCLRLALRSGLRLVGFISVPDPTFSGRFAGAILGRTERREGKRV